MKDEELLNWAEFVATKFYQNGQGWVYSRDLGDLKHLRYASDYTGWNHWTKRLGRALRAWNPREYIRDNKEFPFTLDTRRKPSIRGYFRNAWIATIVHLEKNSNLPDGQINGILTNWEEDGEYIAAFQPRVGLKVLDFLRAEPDNEYAKAILAEMHAIVALSWPEEKEDSK